MPPRYWVIAPFANEAPWESVWQFDLANEVISIGWEELGDFSKLSEAGLRAALHNAYGHTQNFNMLWNFYHSIHVGDTIIARRGLKVLAGVGTVTKEAFYSRNKNIQANPDHPHSNYLGVRWHNGPRNKEFSNIVFIQNSVQEILESKYQELISGKTDSVTVTETVDADVLDSVEFVLERYLEDFMVSNFGAIFGSELVLYRDPENNVGQQYQTDVGPIDILARDIKSNSFVVIELKKGQHSDKVVGQILRYMGWVSEHLCRNEQKVRGIIVCKESDKRLSYALKAVKDIVAKYYTVDFKLSNTPSNRG
jgi:restriction system protein